MERVMRPAHDTAPSTRSPAVTFSKTKSGVTSAMIASTSRAKNASR